MGQSTMSPLTSNGSKATSPFATVVAHPAYAVYVRVIGEDTGTSLPTAQLTTQQTYGSYPLMSSGSIAQILQGSSQKLSSCARI